MKNLLILFLFLTCQNLASAQVYIDHNGFLRYQPPSLQVVRDTVIKTVTVTVKDTVYYCPPVTQPPTTPPVVVQPVPSAEGYRLVYQNNFDKLADLTTNNGQYGNGTVVNGTFYSRPANVSSGTRSELQISSAVTPSEGAAEWDARYEVIVRDNGHSWQIHPETSGGSASPGLWHIGGKFVINNWVRDAGGYNISYPTGVTIPLNTWNKYRIEWKYGTNGYIRFYMDGKLILDKTGRVNDGSGGYLKFGWNGWGSDAAKSRIYIDNVKVFEKVGAPSIGLIIEHGLGVGFSGSLNLDLDSILSKRYKTLNLDSILSKRRKTTMVCAVDHGGEPCPGYPNPAPIPSRIDTVPPAPKTYKLELTEQEVGTLMYVITKGKLDGISGEDAGLIAMGLPVSSGGGQYFKLGQNNFNLSAEDGKGRVYYDNLKIYQKK